MIRRRQANSMQYRSEQRSKTPSLSQSRYNVHSLDRSMLVLLCILAPASRCYTVRNLRDRIQGDTAGAQEALLGIEKQCRLAEDFVLSRESCIAILDVLQAAGDWKGLLEHITMLTKRRGQLKATIQVFTVLQILRFHASCQLFTMTLQKR